MSETKKQRENGFGEIMLGCIRRKRNELKEMFPLRDNWKQYVENIPSEVRLELRRQLEEEFAAWERELSTLKIQ